MTTKPGSPSNTLADLWAGLLARRTARGWAPVALQIALIFLFHVLAILFVQSWSDIAAADLRQRWFAGYTGEWGDLCPLYAACYLAAECLDEIAAVIAPLMGIASLEGLLAYIPFSFVAAPSRARFALFARSWYRTWLWGFVVLTITAFIGRFPMHFYVALTGAVLIAAYFIFGPAWFAQLELRQRRLRTRWRPVCPECGYSLRRLLSRRCPECGAAFPTPARTFRRWANRRIAWDRIKRGSLVVGYVRTLLTIVACPWRAARGLALPDRFGRGIRWACAHLAIVAFLGLLGRSGEYFIDWTRSRLSEQSISIWMPAEASPVRFAAWVGCSFVAWFVALAMLPALGAALAIAVPGRHPAAKRGIAKWSLYATACLVPFAIMYSACVVAYWIYTRIVPVSTSLPDLFRSIAQLRISPLLVAVLIYAVWWAAGVSANPYLRRRGTGACAVHAVLLVLAWLVITRLLFRPGPLSSLL